jgi:hypothetical protein
MMLNLRCPLKTIDHIVKSKKPMMLNLKCPLKTQKFLPKVLISLTILSYRQILRARRQPPGRFTQKNS